MSTSTIPAATAPSTSRRALRYLTGQLIVTVALLIVAAVKDNDEIINITSIIVVLTVTAMLLTAVLYVLRWFTFPLLIVGAIIAASAAI